MRGRDCNLLVIVFMRVADRLDRQPIRYYALHAQN
jgi:hypothetical protein